MLCCHCTRKFSTKWSRDRHMTSCIRLRTCDHCHHLATSTTELTKHVQNCERFEKTCVNCGAKEHSDYAFRIHLRNCLKKRQSFSSQPRPFRCHACGFKSLGRKELTRHITLQHGGSGSLQDFDVELPDDDALKQARRPARAELVHSCFLCLALQADVAESRPLDSPAPPFSAQLVRLKLKFSFPLQDTTWSFDHLLRSC